MTTSGRHRHAVQVVGPADAPAVLLLHPWWGITPAVHGWADTLAGAGRRVVIPDLYDGRTADTVEEAEALADALDREAAAGLIGRCADALAAEERPWAAMGFSLGAFLACPLAGRGAAGPQELVLFYGGQPPGGDDVRTRRVAFHLAPGDEYFPAEELTPALDAFTSAGAEVERYQYDGSGHWFAEEGTPGYDPEAADLARSRVLEQLRPA